MPGIIKHPIGLTIPLLLLLTSMGYSFAGQVYEGIQSYYIRYDIKSSKNKLINVNFLMVPSKNDFRAANFSRISTKGAVSADPGETKEMAEKRIKESALKALLVNKGLRSVTTKDYDTVISYEGVILSPVRIIENTYHEDQGNYTYEVTAEFSPIAFPDRWEQLNFKYKIKEVFYNFFQLFN